MQRQLTLINADDTIWRLDEETREVGRRGVAEARAALRSARRRNTTTDDDHATAA